MFYLGEFSKLLRNHFLMTIIFLVSSFAMVLVLGQREVITKKVALFQKSNMNSYFNALVVGTSNIDGVKRKMKNLPGVTDVIISGAGALNNEIKHLKTNFGEDTIGKLAALNYRKVKIELDETINLKNQNLIQEYLKRLIGKENVTLGAIKKPRGLQLNEKDPLFLILNYLEYYLFAIFFSLFVIATSVLTKTVRKQAFIIEKFQRKNKVGVKIFTIGAVGSVSFALLVNFFLTQGINSIILVPIGLIFAVLVLFNLSDLSPKRVRG